MKKLILFLSVLACVSLQSCLLSPEEIAVNNVEKGKGITNKMKKKLKINLDERTSYYVPSEEDKYKTVSFTHSDVFSDDEFTDYDGQHSGEYVEDCVMSPP